MYTEFSVTDPVDADTVVGATGQLHAVEGRRVLPEVASTAPAGSEGLEGVEERLRRPGHQGGGGQAPGSGSPGDDRLYVEGVAHRAVGRELLRPGLLAEVHLEAHLEVNIEVNLEVNLEINFEVEVDLEGNIECNLECNLEVNRRCAKKRAPSLR